MYKLLLVDDFEIDRDNIKECIDWNTLDIVIQDEANNGVEAFEYMNSCRYDIMLTDVQMPFMDGIELARKAIQLYPNIKVVFMSYYDDFDYLKSAIDLNAYGYILKPYVEDEVKLVFEKLIVKLNEEVRMRKMLEESRPLLVNRFYKNLFSHILTDEEKILLQAKYLKQSLQQGYFQVVAIERYEEDQDIEDNYITDIQLNHQIVNYCRRYNLSLIGISDDNYHFIILNEINKKDLIGLNLDFLEGFGAFIGENVPRYAIGISSIKEGLKNIAALYDEAIHALKFSFYYGQCKLLYYEEIADTSISSMPIHLDKMQEDIKILITSGDLSSIHQFIHSLFDGIVITKDNHYLNNIMHAILICLHIVMAELGNGSMENTDPKDMWEMTSQNFTTFSQVSGCIKELIISCSNDYKISQKRKKNKVIAQIKQYVEKNYMLDITVKEIATDFFYSPNYLNGLFKKKVGKSIPDYITEFRVNKAKELLNTTNMKIYEIIEVVGYKRASHFNNIFKRYVGVTPKEYRGKANDF